MKFKDFISEAPLRQGNTILRPSRGSAKYSKKKIDENKILKLLDEFSGGEVDAADKIIDIFRKANLGYEVTSTLTDLRRSWYTSKGDKKKEFKEFEEFVKSNLHA